MERHQSEKLKVKVINTTSNKVIDIHIDDVVTRDDGTAILIGCSDKDWLRLQSWFVIDDTVEVVVCRTLYQLSGA